MRKLNEYYKIHKVYNRVLTPIYDDFGYSIDSILFTSSMALCIEDVLSSKP